MDCMPIRPLQDRTEQYGWQELARCHLLCRMGIPCVAAAAAVQGCEYDHMVPQADQTYMVAPHTCRPQMLEWRWRPNCGDRGNTAQSIENEREEGRISVAAGGDER